MEDQKKEVLSEDEVGRYSADVQEALRQGLPLNIIYRNLSTQYSRVKAPDKSLLAEYVMRAKGPERSMRQFAEEIGVNASTLSRIINKKTVGANSDYLIADIAAHADKNSNITFEMLMHAHGMEDTVSFRSHIAYEREVEASYKSILIDALLKRGYSVALREPERHNTLGGRYQFDLEVMSNALPDDEDVWGMEFCPVQAPRGQLQTGSGTYRGMQILRRLSRMSTLFADYDYRYARMSLVLSDSQAFHQATERLNDCYLNYAVTLILINLETGDVEAEFMVPWIDETKCKEIFTPMPEIEDEDTDTEDEALWNSELEDQE